MLYSSPEFILLFALTLAGFLLVCGRDKRLLILLTASLLFYAWSGWFNLLVYLFVVGVAWASLALARRYPARKGGFLTSGIVVMAAYLFFWKYASWAVSQLQIPFPSFFGGKELSLPLPIGISFFTLQGVAYLVDYRHDEADYMPLATYLLFKSFFAQLIAGPIVRARQLLPQLERLETPKGEDISAGLGLFTLGLYKKLVVADGLGPFVDAVFAAPHGHGRWTLLQALCGYTVQIWADFSGYTDMGRGAARMLGIRLPENFLSPYLSRTPSEFWRRWHITLSEWMRDYIYAPLALSIGSGSVAQALSAVVVTMGLCGLWHGAQWHFALWGIYHGGLLVVERQFKLRTPESDAAGWAAIRSLVSTLATLGLVMFGWLIFRAENFYALAAFIKGLALDTGSAPAPDGAWVVPVGILFCVLVHILGYYDLRQQRWAVDWPGLLEGWAKPEGRGRVLGFCLGGTLAVLFVGAVILRQANARPFIYFQF